MTDTRKSVPVSNEGKEGRPSVPTTYGWEPFASLRQEIDRLFGDLTSGWGMGGRALPARTLGGLAAIPAADVVENDDAFITTLDLPGLEQKDIEVTVSDGAISIHGEKSEETKEERESYRLHERHYGSFSRSFALPASIDPDGISATYEKGVLKLVMPKSEDAKKRQRKIEVQAA